jgi:hypothetical protein
MASNPETNVVMVDDPLDGGVVGFEVGLVGEFGDGEGGCVDVGEPEQLSGQPRAFVSHAMTALPCEEQLVQHVARSHCV